MLIFWIIMKVLQELDVKVRSEFFICFPRILGEITDKTAGEDAVISGQLQALLADTDKVRSCVLAVHWAQQTLGTDGERFLYELCYDLVRMKLNFEEYQKSTAANALMEVIGRTTLEYDRQIAKTDYSDHLPVRLLATLNEYGGGCDQQNHPVYAFFHESMNRINEEMKAAKS
jgi:hypothetical protein